MSFEWKEQSDNISTLFLSLDGSLSFGGREFQITGAKKWKDRSVILLFEGFEGLLNVISLEERVDLFDININR